MADQEFTVEHAGPPSGVVLEAEADYLEAQTVAQGAISAGAAEVAAGHDTPVQQTAHGVPGAAASLQAALHQGAAAAQAQPAYSPLTATPDASSSASATATASTYDDKPDHTSALAAPIEATAVEEPKHEEPAPAPEPEHPPEAAHEPEATHTEAATDGDHSA